MNRPSDYTNAMDSLRFTPEQKAQIARRAAMAAGNAAPARKKRLRPVARTAVIAACCALALGVTAGAAGILPTPAEVFGPLFGGSPAQTEIIDKIGYPIGASDTDQGVTVTADAVMGDKYNAAVVFTFTRDDGATFLPEGISARQLLVRGSGADFHILGGAHGGAWFVDEDPTDNKIQMIETRSSDVALNDCTATADFDGLWYFDETAGEALPLIDGHWTFKFDVAYEDSAVTLGGGETFTREGLTFTIDAITLSPVAVKVDYTVDREVVWSDSGSGRQDPADAEQTRRYMENVEILLMKTDGTVIDLTNSGGSIAPGDGRTVCSKGEVFSQIVPLAEMVSISVGGVVYPVN